MTVQDHYWNTITTNSKSDYSQWVRIPSTGTAKFVQNLRLEKRLRSSRWRYRTRANARGLQVLKRLACVGTEPVKATGE